MVVGCVGIGYVLRVEIPVQRRLCPIFMRDVGSPDIHEYFRGLMGSQRTLGNGASQYATGCSTSNPSEAQYVSKLFDVNLPSLSILIPLIG